MSESVPIQKTVSVAGPGLALGHRSKIEYFALGLLLTVYLIVALAHAYLAPLTTGPDELAHYEYVHFIAEQGRLPQDYDERSQASYKSDQPPLFHLLAAIPAAWVDPTGPPTLKRVIDHPRRQLIERTRHAWGLYNTEDERWPYRAEVLRWHVGRWVAILFGAGTVVVTYFIARESYIVSLPGPPKGGEKKEVSTSRGLDHDGGADAERLQGTRRKISPFGGLGRASKRQLFAFSVAAIVAFIPRFALTGSMLNYETALAFFSALFLWALLRIAKGGPANQEPQRPALCPTYYTLPFILLGLFTGLAITAKLSAIILPLEVVLGLWLIKRARSWPWWMWQRGVIIAGLTTLGAVSWWFGFVIYQFNTAATDGWWIGLLRPLIAADASDATTNRLLSMLTGGEAGFTAAIENLDSGPPWEWLAIFFRTFWVAGIEGVQPLGWLGLTLALGLCLLAVWGLIQVWQTTDKTDYLRLTLTLFLLHLLLPILLPLVRYAVTFSLADTAQGRHVLFAASPALAMLLVWGLVSLANIHLPHLPFPISRFLSFVPGLFFLTWSGVQLWIMSWAYLPLLPVQTTPTAASAHLRDQVLNNYVTLVGFDSELNPGVLQLDLLWRATAVSPVDYLTEVSVIDSQGKLQAQWLGHPAGGRYPTRAWDVGDTVRDSIWLPLPNLVPDQYQVTLNLSATTLNPSPVAPQHLKEPLRLTTFELTETTPAKAEPQLWQNGRPVTGASIFRYRETVLVTLGSGQLNQPDQIQLVHLVDIEPQKIFTPVRLLDQTALFMVGPEWTTGRYQLQVVLAEGAAKVIEGASFEVIDRWQRHFDEPSISHPLQANFANQVKLLGYDLGANRARPGGGIPVTFYWQGLDWMGTDYTIFTKLLAVDQSVHGGRDRLPREGYRTIYWAPGEIIDDSFGVPIDPKAPEGVYYLNVGLYQQVGEQAVSLPLVQDGQPLEATSVNLGPLKIGAAASNFTLKTANPENPLAQPFGDHPNLTLLGYDLAPPTIGLDRLPDVIKLKLYWRSEAPLPLDYTVFVHLRDPAGQIVAQKDQPPLAGAYPTSLWDAGEIVADEIVLPLPETLPAGVYNLVIGLYDFYTGVRLTVPDHLNNELGLVTIEVK